MKYENCIIIYLYSYIVQRNPQIVVEGEVEEHRGRRTQLVIPHSFQEVLNGDGFKILLLLIEAFEQPIEHHGADGPQHLCIRRVSAVMRVGHFFVKLLTSW